MPDAPALPNAGEMRIAQAFCRHMPYDAEGALLALGATSEIGRTEFDMEVLFTRTDAFHVAVSHTLNRRTRRYALAFAIGIFLYYRWAIPRDTRVGIRLFPEAGTRMPTPPDWLGRDGVMRCMGLATLLIAPQDRVRKVVTAVPPHDRAAVLADTLDLSRDTAAILIESDRKAALSERHRNG